MDKFWMVWKVGDKGPTHKHPSLESAKTEAERLALIHALGTDEVVEMVILEALAVGRRRSIIWEDIRT